MLEVKWPFLAPFGTFCHPVFWRAREVTETEVGSWQLAVGGELRTEPAEFGFVWQKPDLHFNRQGAKAEDGSWKLEDGAEARSKAETEFQPRMNTDYFFNTKRDIKRRILAFLSPVFQHARHQTAPNRTFPHYISNIPTMLPFKKMRNGAGKEKLYQAEGQLL